MAPALTGTNFDFSSDDGNVADGGVSDTNPTGWNFYYGTNPGERVASNFQIHDVDTTTGINAGAGLTSQKGTTVFTMSQELNETIDATWTTIDYSFDAQRFSTLVGKNRFFLFVDNDGDGVYTNSTDILLADYGIGQSINSKPADVLHTLSGSIDLSSLDATARAALNGKKITVAFIAAGNGGTKTQYVVDNLSLSYDHTPVPCFAEGVKIRVRNRMKPVEKLKIGELVWTLDHGFQPIRWIGKRSLYVSGNSRPIIFKAGAIGNEKTLTLSAQHCVYISSTKLKMMFGSSELLIPAHKLINDHDILWGEAGEVTYYHFLFDHHEIVNAEGALVESLLPSAKSAEILENPTSKENIEVFPELEEYYRGGAAREVVRGKKALLAAKSANWYSSTTIK